MTHYGNYVKRPVKVNTFKIRWPQHRFKFRFDLDLGFSFQAGDRSTGFAGHSIGLLVHTI